MIEERHIFGIDGVTQQISTLMNKRTPYTFSNTRQARLNYSREMREEDRERKKV